ncbi:MAG TPA: DUF3443 family protein [Kofleriaceae bacterium]|jgi:hypothetical protein
MKTMVLALAVLTPACTSAPGDTGHDGVAPLEVRHSSSGSVRFGAWIQIGDRPPFLALVDTGSSGLRVLPSAVDDGAYASITDTLVSFSYHSGLALQGVLATGTVTIGGLATPRPIPIMRVRTVGCTADVPDCDAAGESADDYQAFGYDAVLGIGMRNLDTSAGIGNPIAQLAGAPSYIVRGPDIGGDTASLQIAPAASDTARFASVVLPPIEHGAPLPGGVPAWDDRAVPACVTDETHDTPFCAGALLDTGATSTQLESPAFTGAPQTWASGTLVAVAIGETSAPLASYDFTVGATPVAGIDKVVSETRTNSTDDMINLGTAPFLRDDVFFDQLHGAIGIGGRAPTP